MDRARPAAGWEGPLSAPPPFLRESPVPTQGPHTGPQVDDLSTAGDFRFCFCFPMYETTFFKHPLLRPPSLTQPQTRHRALVKPPRLLLWGVACDCFPGGDQMSEVLSPEILIIRNTQGGGNDIRGMASVCPAPAPCTSGEEPTRPHYKAGRQDAPGHQQMSCPLGQCTCEPPASRPLGCAAFVHTHAFSVQLIPVAPTIVASSLRSVCP